MALEDLSVGTKKGIIVTVLLGVIALKVVGIFKAKLPFYLIVGLAVAGIITDPSPVAADTLPGKAITGQ